MDREVADLCHLCSMSRAARSIGQRRIEAMSRQVVHRLQRLPASGIFGDGAGLRTVWDEFCFDQQQGPASMLEWAWDSVIDPIIAELVAAIHVDEQYLLTVAAGWQHGEFDLPDGRYDELIRQAVRSGLVGSALDRSLYRLTGR
jgi:hypothetical protein